MRYEYIWFDHCMLRGSKVVEYIEKAILEHDWNTFQCFRKILDKGTQLSDRGTKMYFFPKFIRVISDNEDDDVIEIPLNKTNFMKITDTEYECG